MLFNFEVARTCMASGTSGAEEEMRERHRWSESSKVYTRRIRKGQSGGDSVIRNGQIKCNGSAVSKGNGVAAGNGDITAASDGNSMLFVDGVEIVSSKVNGTVSRNGYATSSDYGGASGVSNGDVSVSNDAVMDNGDTAINVVTKGDIGDAAVVSSGVTALKNDGASRVAVTDCVTRVSDNGITVMSDNGDTVMVDSADTVMADSGDTVIADNGHAAMTDNVDTSVTVHGDMKADDNGDISMADNDDAALVVQHDSPRQSGCSKKEEAKFSQQDLKEHQTSVTPHQLQEDGQLPRQLDECGQSPKQLKRKGSPEQQKEGLSPQLDMDSSPQYNGSLPQQKEHSSPQQQEHLSPLQQQEDDCSPQQEEDSSPKQHKSSLRQQEGSSQPHQHQEASSPPQQHEYGSSPEHQHEEGSSPQQQQQEGVSSRNQLHEDERSVWQLEDGRSPQQLQEARVPARAAEPIATFVDDRVIINLVAARSAKKEAKELKRKLETELNEVRNMAKKLKDKELEISSYSSGIGAEAAAGVAGAGMVSTSGDGGNFGGYANVQYPASHGFEKGPGLSITTPPGLSGVNSTRLNRQLTVSVMDHSFGAAEMMEKEKRTPKANQFYRNSDFILAGERIPPPESNKKMKSAGKKRGGDMNYGFGMSKQISKRCNNLVQKLMKHTYGWVFNKPVDVKGLNLHDYFEIIKHPMDLGTVKTRLNKNWYKSPREFAEDVRLTFHNAMTYNPKGHDVHTMAEQLLQMFEETYEDIEAQYNHRMKYDMANDMGLLTPTPRSALSHMPFHVPLPTPPALSVPLLNPPPLRQEVRTLERLESIAATPRPIYHIPVGRAPALKKPKAKDPDKRDMTYDEKQKLSANLQNLPSEKLENIVQIIKKNRSSAVSQHDEEVEVDIDSCDNETLWELDRFVSNYKKSLSKYRRRAQLALERAEAARALQQPSHMAQQVQTQTEATSDRGQAPAPPVHGETQQNNASQSSSSSSSSSDSSSSGSDSSSSSDSSSDEGH